VIDRRAGRLHDEDVGTADVLVDLKLHLGVREPGQPCLAERDAQVPGNLARQFGVRATGEHLELGKRHPHALTLEAVIDRTLSGGLRR